MPEPDSHRPKGTHDKIKYDLIEKRARLVFFTAMEIANCKKCLKEIFLLIHKELSKG